MAPEIIIERICNLPIAFYAGNKTAVQLVNESGLAQYESALSIGAVSAYLARHPELVAQWLRWSEDKRSSSGWYFMRESDLYIVGYYTKGDKRSFAEALPACAAFIICEVQEICA